MGDTRAAPEPPEQPALGDHSPANLGRRHHNRPVGRAGLRCRRGDYVLRTTSGGRPLTGSAQATVARAPLTASFHGVPAEHDGETPFTFELRFSEEVSLSYVTVRDSAFTVTNGRACNAQGAVCTAAGKQLSNSPSAVLQQARHGGAIDQRRKAGHPVDAAVVPSFPGERSAPATECPGLQLGQPLAQTGPAAAGSSAGRSRVSSSGW